jgi:hypothetical protein
MFALLLFTSNPFSLPDCAEIKCLFVRETGEGKADDDDKEKSDDWKISSLLRPREKGLRSQISYLNPVVESLNV